MSDRINTGHFPPFHPFRCSIKAKRRSHGLRRRSLQGSCRTYMGVWNHCESQGTTPRRLAEYNSYIKFYTDFEPEAKKCMILKFILQPLVENSIFHGFNNQSEDKAIRITARIQDEKLYIEVMDNGRGMDKQTLQKIMDRNNTGLTSIGLPNVERRIQAKFGEEYGLKITSEADKGCLVTVVLPKI